MARIPFPGFVSGSYTTRSFVHGSERCVNLVLEDNPSTKQAALYGTPGLRRVAYLPSGPMRALYTASQGRVFAVAGSTLYELLPGGAGVPRGTLGGTQPVSMADNGIALMLVDGTSGYVLDFATHTYQQVTDPDMPHADFVVFLDGYFVLNVHGTGQYMLTGLYDPLHVGGLDHATAEARPDPIVAHAADHRELWLFGSQTIEVAFNSGNPDFPIERISGAVIEQGCIAPWSVQALDNTLYWLHGNTRGAGTVLRARGYQPEDITPPGVEWAWSQYPTLTDARAFTYRQSGHAYYVLSFGAGDATWAYDTTTGLWHERAALAHDGGLERHWAACHTYGLGEHLVGDYRTGMVYALDERQYTDDGAPIVRLRRAPHVASDGKRVFHQAFELALEAGVGVDGGAPVQDVNPDVMLRWSNDGGKTYSHEHWANAGPLGAYQTRAIWRRLGQSRNRVYEVRQTTGTPVAWTGAWLDLSEGMH